MKRETAIIVAFGFILVACQHDTSAGSGAVASAAPPVRSAPVPAATPPVAAPFEGEIVVAVKAADVTKVPASITYDVKGDKVRYMPAAGSVHAVADVAAHRASVVSDASKSFAAFDAKPPTGAAPASTVRLTKTSKSETVAGHTCEDWLLYGGDEDVDVCAAKGIAFFDLASDPKPGNVEPSWAATLTREKAFPLRVVVHDKAGKEEYRAEVTKMKAKRLDDAVFQVPSGFAPKNLSAAVRTASLP